VTFPIAGERFQYTWDAPVSDFDFYLINISGPDNQCGSRESLHRSTENSYTCSGWSPAGQNYTLSMLAVNCGGEGPASDPVTVFLRSKKLLFACLGYSFSVSVWKAVKYFICHFLCIRGFYCTKAISNSRGRGNA